MQTCPTPYTALTCTQYFSQFISWNYTGEHRTSEENNKKKHRATQENKEHHKEQGNYDNIQKKTCKEKKTPQQH